MMNKTEPGLVHSYGTYMVAGETDNRDLDPKLVQFPKAATTSYRKSSGERR